MQAIVSVGLKTKKHARRVATLSCLLLNLYTSKMNLMHALLASRQHYCLRHYCQVTTRKTLLRLAASA